MIRYPSHIMMQKRFKKILPQKKVIEYQKVNKHKTLFSILIIVDDMADAPEMSRNSKILHGLYTKGRHSSISTITSVQKFTSLHPIIRVNATDLFIYKLRNYRDLEAILEELGAIEEKKLILEIYNMATAEPYSFLYVNLRATSKNHIFLIRFEKRIEIED